MMSFTENGTPMSAPARSERSRARASVGLFGIDVLPGLDVLLPFSDTIQACARDVLACCTAGADRGDYFGRGEFIQRAGRNHGSRRQSTLMLASLMTFAHLSVSAEMNLAKASGVVPSGTTPPVLC